MQKAHSADGTPIAFDRVGEGQPLIVVGGALSDRSAVTRIAEQLAPHFTVYGFDRRGRGDSGDTQPYAVEREIEDIEALIDQAGGAAFVLGHSSGAGLSLEATKRLGAKVKKLALYEPPFIVDGSREPIPGDYVAQLQQRLDAGKRGDAVEYFLTRLVGIPAPALGEMRQAPMWAAMERLAHTLPYDNAVMGDTMSGNPLPAKRWAAITQPTLVLVGGSSPTWMHNGTRSLVDTLPNAQHRTLEGQNHAPAPEILAPALIEFFLS